MTRRKRRLLLTALIVCALTSYFSCTQPEDVLTPVSRTDLYIWGGPTVPGQVPSRPQNVPSNPIGMLYELWLANETDTVSLGKFGYNQFWGTFRDENGEDRADSNHFVLNADILAYSHIFVSVETDPDDDSLSPGPIMLIDDVSLPSNNLMELIFPLSDSLWNITAIFNMETPSDTDRALNPGYGIWFSAFYWSQDSIQDTVSLDSFRLVTKIDEEITIDTTTTWVEDIVNVRTEDTIRVFGLDTFVTRVVRFDSIIRTDDTFPYTVMNMEAGATAFWYTVGIFDTLTQTLYEDSVRPFFYDNFIQFDFGFWDYSDWGWHYKGWVVSPNVNRDALGEITPPAYRVNTSPLDSLMPGIEGGLLTTGTFTDVSSPDDSNPYAKGPRIPPIAGEDFIENLPAGAFTGDGLVPDATGNSGTVFITLEPDNFSTDTTNFPLFVLVRKIPTLRDSIFGTAMADQQLFFMRTLTQVNDYTRGFPKIVVDIRRF